MKAEEFGKYLRNLRKERGLTIRQIEVFSGVSNSYLSLVENGKRGIPSPEILEKLAPVYKVPYEQLMTAAGYLEGDKLVFREQNNTYDYIQRTGRFGRATIELADILEREDVLVTAGGEPLSHTRRLSLLKALENVPNEEKRQTVPLLGTIKAGIPLLSEQNIIDHIHIPADLEGQVTFALEVKGDSMVGAGITAGDIVLCKQTKSPRHGDIVVALVNHDETTLKYFIQQNGTALLRAANPEYKDFILNQDDTIQGIVVKIQKEAPTLDTYREFIYYRDKHFGRWNEIIEMAIANGIDPAIIKGNIKMQIEMAQKIAGK